MSLARNGSGLTRNPRVVLRQETGPFQPGTRCDPENGSKWGGFPAPGAGNLIIRPRGGKLARLNVMPGFTTAATVDFPPAGGLRLGGTLALWGRWLLNHFVYSVAVQDSVSLVYSKRAPMLYTLSFQLPALAQQLICGAKRCVLRAYKRHLVHYRLRPFRQLVHSC
ncbi:hypothetical protein Dda_2934 [Drechslerella dactyloides]|uniref:Uncharacterized protein n=1 Tax=Drechslerella dactyloides TaxID=74499 RepID=A0AAD6J1Z5_DREDA|nr:hypothetical protein Dda_2934 [Drechslerella dactyloides]